MKVLCVNAGSSSMKCALYAMPREQLLAEGELDELLTMEPDAVGHRVVFGGEQTAPMQLDRQAIAHLRSLVPFAPLHLPPALEVIERLAGSLPQVACFDTAFHAAMPELAKRFPLPEEFWASGVHRYGFHGLSYEYICTQVSAPRLVIAHLGNGASLAAVKGGQPWDTTMGLTPTGGLMMGTRCGDLDPGVLLYLLRERGYTAETLEQLLDHGSGLLGVSGTSADMRELLGEGGLAIDLFCYIARKHIGAMAAALGGLDLLVFTGGIGEHAVSVREQICADLAYLKTEVQVIPTNEDLMIARHTHQLETSHAPT